MIISFLTLLKN